MLGLWRRELSVRQVKRNLLRSLCGVTVASRHAGATCYFGSGNFVPVFRWSLLLRLLEVGCRPTPVIDAQTVGIQTGNHYGVAELADRIGFFEC
jgi:hypothetical protein